MSGTPHHRACELKTVYVSLGGASFKMTRGSFFTAPAVGVSAEEMLA